MWAWGQRYIKRPHHYITKVDHECTYTDPLTVQSIFNEHNNLIWCGITGMPTGIRKSADGIRCRALRMLL